MGILFKISRNGKISYLYGTVHSAEFHALSNEAMTAFKNSNHVLVEEVTDNSTKLPAMQMDCFNKWFQQQKKKYEGHLPTLQDQEKILLMSIFKVHNQDLTPVEIQGQVIKLFATKSPLQIAMFISRMIHSFSSDPQYQAIFKYGERLDDLIRQQARVLKKNLVGLESEKASVQLMIGTAFDYDQHMKYLRHALSEIVQDDYLDKTTGKSLSLYRKGDFQGLLSMYQESREKIPEELKEFTAKLTFNRDSTLVRNAEPYLNEGGAFIAVGVGHLNGVITLLQQQGYDIEAVSEGPRVNSLKDDKALNEAKKTVVQQTEKKQSAANDDTFTPFFKDKPHENKQDADKRRGVKRSLPENTDIEDENSRTRPTNIAKHK